MVYLSKKEVDKIIETLSKTKNKEIQEIIKKLKSPQKKLRYVRNQPEIEKLLKKAFNNKNKVKINYYSLSSDEVTSRIIDVYQLHKDCIIAYCKLRKGERTFVINRINKEAILDEGYSIPSGWSPESIILDK